MNEISEVLPRRVVGLRRGEGSFLFIDLEPEGSAQVSLWVYMCDWVLNYGKNTISSADVNEEFDLSDVALGDMISVGREEGVAQVSVNFSTGAKLTLSNEDGFYSDEDDYYMLFVGDDWVAKYSEQHGFSVRRQ